MQRTRIIKPGCIIAAVTFLVSAMALDSETWIPFILCSLSIGWLTLVGIANEGKLHRCNRKEKR